MARLRKSDAETLMAAIDSELLQSALASSLRRILDVDGYDGDWAALVRLAAERGCWDAARQWSVVHAERVALEMLAIELNERRDLHP